MKLFHIADLHLGKRVGEFSLLEDQRYILDQILDLTGKESPDGILIAGDVYDKGTPPGDAVELLDDFLTELAVRGIPVFLVSGNHDSPERLNFGSRILGKDGVFIAGTFQGQVRTETLRDGFGEVRVFLLPYLKPAMVRPFFGAEIDSFDGAVRAALETAALDPGARSILVAHQFVTSGAQQPERSDPETISVGGLDNVDASAFDGFDYVALGHLHGPQRIGRDTVRYAGSPLKYSFSEARQHKSVTVLELGEKGDVRYRLFPLVPRRDMREVKGPIEEILRAGACDTEGSQDYIRAVLTDEEELYDAVGRLRQVYPNLMRLDFENSRTAPGAALAAADSDVAARQTPAELFAEFYQKQNNTELSESQLRVMEEIFEQAGGGAE